MEFLNRAHSQLQGIYRSMTPTSRLTAGALAVVVLLSLGYLGLHRNAETLVDLTRGTPLDATQIAAIEDAFRKANLTGYEIQGNTIRVPRERQAAFMDAMAGIKVLAQDFGDAQLDAVNSGSIFDPPDRQEERRKIARQIDLQQTILKRPGITYAKVFFDVDNKPGGFQEKVRTALVSVKRGDGVQIDEATISAINGTVVHAYAGLKPENVAVSDLNGRTWYGDPRKNGDEGNAYFSLKRNCEQDLKAKILDALCHIPNVTVGVNVELDRKLPAVEKPAQQIAAPADRRIESGESTIPNHPDTRKNPSDASSEQPNMAKVINALLGESRVNGNAVPSPAGNNVPEEQVEKDKFASAPISARVSIGVPASYFKTVWQRRNPVEPGHVEKTPDQATLDRIRIEESANIQRCIIPLLPPTRNAILATELVTVTTFQDIPLPEPTSPEIGQIALSWLSRNGYTVGLVALILVCLMAIRSIVRNGTSAPAEAATPTTDEALDAFSPEEPDNVPPAHWKRQDGSDGASLREELSEFVEEDPETAANILRNWIGQAS
jgi:flagellar M-ring protein FliF